MTQPSKNFALADEIIATREVFWVNPILTVAAVSKQS